MRLVSNITKKIKYFTIFFSVLILVTGCSSDDQGKESDNEDEAVISLSLKATSSSINEDKVNWEDRVDELRMVVFNTSDGKVVFNQKLYFPNGFANSSKSVVIRPGNYDFYFIANESVYSTDFASALMAIGNKSQFSTDTRFRNLQYNPDFIPSETGRNGRFVMSAIYNNIAVTSGGTEKNPVPLAIPTGKIELIRPLAKVDVIFRKKVAGSSIPANTITSVQLSNVAASLSIPPVDNYYSGQKTTSKQADISGLNYDNDSIGAVTFFIPEFLIQENSTDFTELHINNKVFPIETDDGKTGIALQRRTIPSISSNSVIRNYHYIVNAYINAQGGIQIKAYIEPWNKDEYRYVFQGDKTIVVPPVIPTDSSVIIIPVLCEGSSKIEILNKDEILPQGLQGAYGDVVNYWDPVVQGPSITKGQPPYYCEKKYGPGWRLINSCELMSFLALFDQAYRIWQSNTWEGVDNNLPFYPLPFRQEAQAFLQKLTGVDLSGIVLSDNEKDNLGDAKLDVIDRFFTPGDIMIRESDYPGGWPYTAPPNNSGLAWFYSEVVVQVKAYWYTGYLDLSIPGNKEKVLYEQFERYDFSSTVSRCVRVVE